MALRVEASVFHGSWWTPRRADYIEAGKLLDPDEREIAAGADAAAAPTSGGTPPYHLIFCVKDGELVVIAYAHERRRPGCWRDRLEHV